MKSKYIGLLFFIAVLFTACGNNRNATNQSQGANMETGEDKDAVIANNFYKRLEGTIADQPVVMHLQAYNGRLQGMYYYEKIGMWIPLEGLIDSKNPNNLKIIERDLIQGDQDAIMECSYNQGTIKGSWRSSDGKKNYLIDLKEAYPDGSYTFTTATFNDSIKAFAQKAESPVARVYKEILIPTQQDEASQWLTAQIRKSIGADSSIHQTDLKITAQQMNTSYLQSYQEEVKNTQDTEFVSFLNYEDMQNISVSFNDHGYVILDFSLYAYTGGAHGNGGSTFYCLDVNHKKAMKLNDVISIDTTRLQPILETAFRKANNLSPTDSLTSILFENHLSVTQNFYFTSKGIGFYYFPYEVAAYANGAIQVFVPYTSLKAYLNPDFMHRMNIQ